MPEPEVVEPDQLRLGAKVPACASARLEQVLGGGEARILAIHGGRGDAEDAQRPGRAIRGARQRMRRVRQLVALADGLGADEQAAVLFLHP